MVTIRKRLSKALAEIRKPVPKTIVFRGKRYTHVSGAAYSKSFRDSIVEDLVEEGYATHVTFTKPRGYQVYKRRKRGGA